MFLISRRQMAVLAAWSVAATRAWANTPLTPREQELHEAAKREGEITWYSGQYSADASERRGAPSTSATPGCAATVRSTSQVAFQRRCGTARVAQCDVLSSTMAGTTSSSSGKPALQYRRSLPRAVPTCARPTRTIFSSRASSHYLMGHNPAWCRRPGAEIWTDIWIRSGLTSGGRASGFAARSGCGVQSADVRQRLSAPSRPTTAGRPLSIDPVR